MRSRNAIVSLLFLIFFTAIYLYRNNQSPTEPKQYITDKGRVFGTMYKITYESSKSLKEEIEAKFKEYDLSLSPFNKQSIITKVNQNDSSVVLDKWFTHVFNNSKIISSKTEGAFDITVAPLVNAWGFGFKEKEKVTPQLVDSLLQFVGIEKVELKDGRIVKSDPRLILDCSSIAKGYACDVIGEMLLDMGCENYLVDIGGEISCRGMSSKGRAWRVGINEPVEDGTIDNDKIEEIVSITDMSMATSGNYRNFYYEDGKRYAHTIDPKSGYPIQHELLSATVFAPDCMTADAYATAFMVLGLEKAMRIIEEDPKMEGYFIYTNGSDKYQISYSYGVKDMIIK